MCCVVCVSLSVNGQSLVFHLIGEVLKHNVKQVSTWILEGDTTHATLSINIAVPRQRSSSSFRQWIMINYESVASGQNKMCRLLVVDSTKLEHERDYLRLRYNLDGFMSLLNNFGDFQATLLFVLLSSSKLPERLVFLQIKSEKYRSIKRTFWINEEMKFICDSLSLSWVSHRKGFVIVAFEMYLSPDVKKAVNAAIITFEES